MIYHIKVTQDDIDRGEPHELCGCPVALAVTRATGRRMSVNYTYGTNPPEPFIECPGVFVLLPENAGRFVHAFDDMNGCGCFESFEFDIDLPEDCT